MYRHLVLPGVLSLCFLFQAVTEPQHAQYRHDRQVVLNDLTFTPGGTIPENTSIVLCARNFRTGTIRASSVPQHKLCTLYGIDKEDCHGLQPDGSGYEIDHLISLELGGSNEESNLWPEPYNPKPGAKEKDTVENYLHREVCNGNMTLAFAQKLISTDWYAEYDAATGATP